MFRLRRATSEVANSRYVTPEVGFTPAQIRLAEFVIGCVVVAFVVVVIYFTFQGNWLN